MNRFFTTALVNKRKALGEKEKGFTLIELLVVVLILGVLAAIAIPIYLGQQESAKWSAVQAQVTQAKTAVALAITDGDPIDTAITALNAATIDSYTPSAQILVVGTAGETAGFSITGTYSDDSTITSTITDTTAATGKP